MSLIRVVFTQIYYNSFLLSPSTFFMPFYKNKCCGLTLTTTFIIEPILIDFKPLSKEGGFLLPIYKKLRESLSLSLVFYPFYSVLYFSKICIFVLVSKRGVTVIYPSCKATVSRFKSSGRSSGIKSPICKYIFSPSTLINPSE